MAKNNKKSTAIADQILSRSHALQANHIVVHTMELAKEATEQQLDSIPDAYFVISYDGLIIRGNEIASRLFGCTCERILNKTIKDLFLTESWNIFSTKLQQLQEHKDDLKSIPFELTMDGRNDKESRHYLWVIEKIHANNKNSKQFVSVFGRDISNILKTEKALHKIYSALPLGIFSVNKEGLISEPCSSYLEYLVGQKNLIGKNFQKTILDPCTEAMSQSDKLGVMEFTESLGAEDTWFELSKDRFPSELEFPIDQNQTRFLHVGYHPVVKNSLIDEVMIIISEKPKVKSDVVQDIKDINVKRALDFQRCDQKILPNAFKDLEDLFEKIRHHISKSAISDVANELHGVKGIARITGFSHLKNIVHKVEHELLESIQSKTSLIKSDLTKKTDLIFREWEMIQKFGLIFNQSTNTKAQSSNQGVSSFAHELQRRYLQLLSSKGYDKPKAKKPLQNFEEQLLGYQISSSQELEKRLTNVVKATSKSCQKKVRLKFEWGKFSVFSHAQADLYSILMHILNNSVDHGIELPDVRKKLKKPAYGEISVTGKFDQKKNFIICIQDDGKGISSEIVAQKSLEKKIISSQKLKKMSPSDICQLIFKPGFSTRNEVSDISGRGIGLDSAFQKVLQLGGDGIKAKNRYKGNKIIGTQFEFKIQEAVQKKSSIRKK